METLALLSHTSPAATVAYRGGKAVAARQFVADVRRLARSLPRGQHVLNVCADRYRFAVGLGACLITGRISLLPATHTPEVITQLTSFAPDAVCLTDDAQCDIELPRLQWREEPAAAQDLCDFAVPQIPLAQLAAIVFTSGSTGTPVPHAKHWGALANCVLNGAGPLGLLDGRPHGLLGTVPAQHMYGFESAVLLALLSANAFCGERPFYPADIVAALARIPRPRVLVTTPVHLRTLLASCVELPAVDLVMSATAPLAQELARQVESSYATKLLEIYGSTETGQIALRRTSQTSAWRLWPGVRLTETDGRTFADGGHVATRTPLCDVIEIIGPQEFLLHGRTADLVNVAGKRSSFAYLNVQLNAIPGVLDGAFYLSDTAGGDVAVPRLGALVVAPGLTAAALTEQLRLRIDPVFLPRPLLLVDALPRNSTGKLPQQALQALAARLPRGQGAR